MNYSVELEKICYKYFADLSENEQRFLYLVTCFFDTNPMPEYKELVADFKIFIDALRKQPLLLYSLDPFEHIYERNPTAGSPNELRLEWLQLMVLQSKNRLCTR